MGRNEQIELENLPEDIVVTVKETDGGEYTVEQNPSDITSKNANTSYTKIGTMNNSGVVTATVGTANGSIGFINTKEGTPTWALCWTMHLTLQCWPSLPLVVWP